MTDAPFYPISPFNWRFIVAYCATQSEDNVIPSVLTKRVHQQPKRGKRARRRSNAQRTR